MSCTNEDHCKKLEQQIELLQQRINGKTETIVRLGKDLEESEKLRKNIEARALNYERNLERVESELLILQKNEETAKLDVTLTARKLKEEVEHLRAANLQLRNQNRELQGEKDDLQKDCRTFRQQIAKYEVEKIDFSNTSEKAASVYSKRTSSNDEIGKFEKFQSDFRNLENDLHTVLGVKEELVIERDELMKKVERLSTEITFLLSGDPRRVAEDLDGLVAENRFLKAQLNTAQEESESIKASLAKYRRMAESIPQRDTPSPNHAENKLDEQGSVAVVNMRQIRELLASQSIELDDSDYKAITTILLDLCNDKQMALTHLRRANKVLGNRLHEVEDRLATFESKSPRSVSPRIVIEQTPETSSLSVQE